MIEMLTEIGGTNREGLVCHPYKHTRGLKNGYFSYTFLNDNRTFKPISKDELLRRIEGGEFNEKGRIRMVPKNATDTTGAGALRVKTYKGKFLPI